MSWQESLTYRGETIVWFLLEIIPTLIMISLWNSLYQSGRFSAAQHQQLVIYYLLTLFISRTTASHFEDTMIDQIKDGFVSFFILKPVSLKRALFALEASWRSTGLIYLIPVILFLPFMVNVSSLNFINLSTIFTLPLLIIYLYTNRFFVSFLITLGAFWFEQAKSLVHLKWMAEGILGGSWLPLFFFPDWWQTIAEFTPFYYWYYFPINLITGRLSGFEIIKGSLISLVWLIFLYICSNIMWVRAVRKYSAAGG